MPTGSLGHPGRLAALTFEPCIQGYQPACLLEDDGVVELWVDYDFCTAGQRDIVHDGVFLAARAAATGERFLAFLATLDDETKEIYWHYGDTAPEITGITPTSQLLLSPAPSHWFGPYSHEKLARMQLVMRMVSERISHGFSYLNITTWPLHIRCADFCAKVPGSNFPVVASHWVEGFVRVCPAAFDLRNAEQGFVDRAGGRVGFGAAIFHELCHRSGFINPILKDRAPTPIGARRLVINGRFDDAFGNIENYVGWAFARESFFGRCYAWTPDDHLQACSSGGDQYGPYPEVCCHECLGGFLGECRER